VSRPFDEQVLMAADADAWVAAPDSVCASEDEAQVWRAHLDCTPSQLSQFEALLNAEETVRARRFRFAVHRNRFVARRGLLRLLLGRYLQVSPESLRLEYTPHGKPSLAKRYASDIRFNLSHSQDVALFVVTLGREAGIDVERIQPDFSDHAIPERFFTPREASTLRALPVSQQSAAFFELWARKEAYVKARGQGLSLPLDSFEVPLDDGEPVKLLHVERAPEAAACWTMRTLRPAPGYAGALAVEGTVCMLRCWNWPDP